MASTPTLKPDTSATEAAPEPIKHKTAPLTPEYRKAHKNYVLVAALLASWELIGINLNTKDKWGIELTSPKAIPLILYTLLIYSAYRMIIEWKQCDDSQPIGKVARLDYYVAHGIGVSAVLIGAIQALLNIRIADTVANTTSFYARVVFGIYLGYIVLSILPPFKHFKGWRRLVIPIIACLIIVVVTLVLRGPRAATIVSIFLALVVIIAIVVVHRKSLVASRK